MSAFDEPRSGASAAPKEDQNSDLGFGAVVTRETQQRFLNRDGTFNVRREGFGFWESNSLYHFLLTISWPKLFGIIVGGYFATNGLFALLYVACGSHALTGFSSEAVPLRLEQAFFFSVATLATIGYGNISPANLAANLVVSVEALVGLLGFAVVTGIVFARLARPTAQIIFSRNAIIAPYGEMSALMFRIVNRRNNQLVDLEAKVMLSVKRGDGKGTADRRFVSLNLERNSVVFFPLTWTVVHPIDEASPLRGMTPESFHEADGEILVLLNGFDETFSQIVHTRSSYKSDEIVWGAKFKSIFNPPARDGVLSVNIRRLHDIEPAALPSK